MADRQAVLMFQLEQFDSMLSELTGDVNARNNVVDRMIGVCLKYRDAEIIKQIANQSPADEEENDESSDNEMDTGSDSSSPSPQELSPFLLQFAESGRRTVVVADIILKSSKGALAKIQDVIIKPAGCARRFAISGTYYRCIDRYIRVCEPDTPIENCATSPWIETHPEGTRHVARILSFNDSHALTDKTRYDLSVEGKAADYRFDIEISHCELLGEVPQVMGQDVDIALMQTDNVYGFRFDDTIEDILTCYPVNLGTKVITTQIKPNKDLKLNLSPFLIKPIDLSYVFVPLPNKGSLRRYQMTGKS